MATMLKGPDAFFVLALALIQSERVRQWAMIPDHKSLIMGIARAALERDMNATPAELAAFIVQIESVAM